MALTTGPNMGLLDNGSPGEAHYAELMRQWRWFDFWLQPMIKSRVAALPTTGQLDGDAYIITAAGADQHKIARWTVRLGTPGWEYMAPKTGWRVHVVNELDANNQVKTIEFVGGVWVDRVVANGGVASVAGKTGAVTLVASDVGAIASAEKGAASGVAALGVDGKVPAAQLPTPTGFANPMTAAGDLIVGGTAGAATRLAAGTNGFVLTLSAGVPTWAAAPGAAGGEANTASNVGTGVGLFKAKNLVDLQFKTLIAGAGIALTAGTDEVMIESRLTLNTQAANYSLALADAGKYVRMNVAAANTVTVLADTTVNFEVGDQIHVRQVGAGQTTIVADAGVTITATETLKLRKQHSTVTLVKVAANSWELFGDTAAT